MVKKFIKLISHCCPIKNRLALKLIFWIGLILILFLKLIFYMEIKTERKLMVDLMEQEACRLSDIIKRSTLHDMIKVRSNELQGVMENIGAQEDVKKVRIIERGYVKMASPREEVGKVIDKQAESCYDCHKVEGEKPLTVSRYRFFKTEDGERVLGFVNPLYNNKECQPCHGTEKKVLGVLDIVLSLENVHKEIGSHQRRSFILIFACFIVIALSIGFFILRFVSKPIKELTYGTRRITNGDLEYHIPIFTKDEMGELAGSFNNMTDQLKGSIKEIEAWNKELSDRVKKATIEIENKNQELAVANKKLWQSDRKKSEVIMLVAHDIRAPLAAVKSCLKVVLDGYLKNDRKKEIEMIKRAEERVESQLDFVKNLLDFTRMEEEHGEMKALSLTPIIQNVVDMMQAWANEKQIKIETRTLFEVWITGDEDLINRSLTNLISNAIKYNPPDTLIWVDYMLKDDRLVLQVGDNGIGIPENEVPEIFEILFRGVQAKRQHDNGAGLGLSIVKRAVELHGGTIRVESRPGEGTIFIIDIPVLKEKPEEEPALAQFSTSGKMAINK